jgi:hypothetical protein
VTSRTLAVITLVAVIVAVAAALISKKAQAHDPYIDWKDRNGFDCCHGRDCKPVRADPTPAGWLVWHEGRWVPVPPAAVLDMPSPDGRSHACIAPGAKEPRCFVPGDTKS